MFTIQSTSVYNAYITLYDKVDTTVTGATYTYELVKEGDTQTVTITNVTGYSTYTVIEIDPVVDNLTPGEYQLVVTETINSVSTVIYTDRVDVTVEPSNTTYSPTVTKKQYKPNSL